MNKAMFEITCQYPGNRHTTHDRFLVARSEEEAARELRLSVGFLKDCLKVNGPAFKDEAVDDGRAYYFIKIIE